MINTVIDNIDIFYIIDIIISRNQKKIKEKGQYLHRFGGIGKQTAGGRGVQF